MHQRPVRRLGLILGLIGMCVGAARAQTQPPAPAPAPIQVLFLGVYHFNSPGQDLHNPQVDDVLTPQRQEELKDAVARLARFNPTKIAVEGVSDRPDFTYPKYEKFTPEMLAENRDERVQIGFRLAKQLGQPAVYGIDEQSDKIDYFPFDAVQTFAKEHGKEPMLEALHAEVDQQMQAFNAAQKTQPVRLLLADINEPAKLVEQHRHFYYAMLALGDAARQPGADLNGGWYLRNAKIFAKLTQVAKPGDRVVVIFGSGHGYWLRHFVENTPGFKLAEAAEYLK